MKDLRVHINCQKGKTLELALPVDNTVYRKDGIAASAWMKTVGGVTAVGLKIKCEAEEPFSERFNLAMETPVRVYSEPDEMPDRITSLYMFSPWWTRPGFADSPKDIPDRTQVALFRYPDRVGCMVPMVGDRFKSYLTGGTDSEFCIDMTAYTGGLDTVDEYLFVYAEGATSREAVHKAFAFIIGEKGILPRSGRRIPDIFRYLGWCSWNAFYTDVSEKLLREKADELIEKEVPVRWMLIDDGWFPSRDSMVTDFAPDKEKFPDGFGPMIDDIRSKSGIRWFGVWHAFGGYWGGVDPESRLAADEEKYLYRTRNNCMIPDYRNGSGFYRDWCDVLRRQGIDFIKVDGQGAVPFYYENEVPVAEAARGMNIALENGSSVMDGAIINCMGMAMENVLARPASAVSRNSDDFFPMREGSFTEHLLENAYNSIYHDEIYCCDWDMFWTQHEFAVKHSLLRAVSGGPVYFSDRIGETDPEVLRPLAYRDGSLLLMSRSAMPTEDCVFSDPVKEGVLKLSNFAPWGGAGNAGGIAAYNLTDRAQNVSFSPEDVPELEGAERYWVYDYFRKEARLLDAGGLYTDVIEKDGFAWYVILPKGRNASCLGLLDKYACFVSVRSIFETQDSMTAVLDASGTAGWLSERDPAHVTVNGADVTDRVCKKENLYYVEIPESMEQTVINVVFE